ncbi:MAG: aspartate--ammonia ligase [Verrucomicrobia bacterium]|nr:aspartate--ammonia ligase [Verrucomicrobiota bacterium]MBR5605975.1 aspartate--ammonia ligase [Verrucomicrobiota bacterium]MBR5690922.1 aspartate--ammonia ligase [Verrucomicrobiota bacterium]MBR5737084.1 aspartate--ammonia ligase [Verrucomicrobiota bacterium]MBR5977785.1 aspartate--ammonia ligase [Verrucomicrobiota bacterium]
MKLKTVNGYKANTSLRETEKAIKLIKDTFETQLAKALNLERISAPLFVRADSGINDDLNGVERPVQFDVKFDNSSAVIVHSLAKWKRMALKAYGFEKGEGLYTDMNAIRRDEDPDNLHSIYVDQWDWELVIGREQRTVEFLKATVKKIVGAVRSTLTLLKSSYPAVHTSLNEEVYFITTQELEDRYPNLSPKAREREIAREHKTVFLMNIGDLLKSGIKHDGRAPDYDDWALNGDLIFWNDVLEDAFELSSMGIRVDAVSLRSQLEKTGTIERMKYPYHQQIAGDILPLTIGGGIGQSRLCMLLLQKAHIGEVQVSLWPDEMLDECKEAGIVIL